MSRSSHEATPPPAKAKRPAKLHESSSSSGGKKGKKGRKTAAKATELQNLRGQTRRNASLSRYDDAYPAATPHGIGSQVAILAHEPTVKDGYTSHRHAAEERYEEDDDDYNDPAGDDLYVPLADRLRADEAMRSRTAGSGSSRKIYPQAPGIETPTKTSGYRKPAGYNRAILEEWRATHRHRKKRKRKVTGDAEESDDEQ
jgi:hypothetical protein